MEKCKYFPHEIVVSILRARLKKDEYVNTNFDLVDWNGVIRYAISQRVVLLLYDYFKSIPSAPKAILNLKPLYRINAVTNIKYEQQVAFIHREFTMAGIPLIVLKGFILSAYLYDDMSLRPSVDLDLLVHKDDFNNAYQLLQERGFLWHSSWGCLHRRFYRQMGHHLSLYNTKSHILRIA